MIRLITLFALAVLIANPSAQRAPVAITAVSEDTEFATFVKSATTKPEFSSPLVDHLPVKAGVPTPKEVLGYHVGAEKKLTYWADQQKWYRALEQAVPGRVKTSVIGKTEEGREIMIVYVTSDANLKNLDQNRSSMRKIADPRGLSAADAQQLIASTKPHYHLSAGLHSGETNTSEMLMELTYRLAVSDEPYIQQIRDNVIVSMVPTTDIDGRDRYVDWYYAYKIDEGYDGGETYGEPPYWGKYVFHDNNRDINYGVDTLRTYLKWYLEWTPPIWHDLHEAQTLLYTYSGGAPQNANWDPLLYSDLMFFANYEVSKLTGYGMPGVWHFGFMDAWSPGYLAIAAQNHNGMLRMYEIFNQGGANTKKARFQGPQTTRQWYRPNPATGEADWSIRNSINYSETAVLTALELTSTVPAMVVENFYKKSINAVNTGQNKSPYGFVIPSGQGDQTRADRIANLLRLQAIEVHRATSEIKVKEGTFPAGSYIVKLNQPYGPLAKTLLEKQVYPDQALQTYDDSAWTMGLANNVEVKTIEDKTILDAAGTLLKSDVLTAGTISGLGPVLVVKHNGALNLVTLRYRLKDIAIKGAKGSFKAGAEAYPAGSFIIPASDRARQEIERLGLVAAALPSTPDVPTTDVDLPRVAIFTTWSNTEKVGWVRLAFDRFEIPFDLIHKDHVKQGNLRGKYDVIVMPHQGNNGKSIVYELPKLSKPLPYRKSDRYQSFGFYTETDDVRGGMGLEGAAELQKFVDEGGTLMSFGIATTFPTEFGIAKGVDVQATQPGFYAPGPYVQSEILIATHPVVFGYNQKTLPVRYAFVSSNRATDGPLLQTGPPPEVAAFVGSSPYRPQVIARYVGGDASVLSGVMRGADQVRNRPMIVDAPSGKGHVLLFTNNPIYRWQTFGEHSLVFNALLYWNDLPSETPAAKPAPSSATAAVRYEEVKTWPALPASIQMGEAAGVAVDTNGHVFVFHRPGRGFDPSATEPLKEAAVLEIDADTGRLIRSWGANIFLVPHGITIDQANNVFLTDVGLHQVFKFSHDGKLLFAIGEPRVGKWDATHFNQPTDIAIRPDGSFYVSDGYVNSRVAIFDKNGRWLQEWGKKGGGDGEFSNPHGLTFVPGGTDVIVADRENSRLQLFDRLGAFKRQWTGVKDAQTTGRVFSVAADAEGALYIGIRREDYDTQHTGVVKLDREWRIVTAVGFGKPGDPVFNAVHDLAVGRDGSIYVAETRTKRVVKLRPVTIQ